MNTSPISVDSDPEPTGKALSLSDATSFEIDRQSGQSISNIGGDQTIYYGEGGRAVRIGKLLAALGLLLSLIGSGLVVALCVTTGTRVHDAHTAATHALHYVPGYWPAAAALLVVGYVVRHFARIMVGR